MENQISKLKIYLFILGFAFVLQVLFSVLFFRHSNLLHSSSLSNIDSLITEIGDLKNDNLLLGNQLQSQISINELNNEFLQTINDKITTQIINDTTLRDELSKYQQYINEEKKRLYSQNTNLSNLLNQKDDEITNLKTSQNLENQLSTADNDTQVFLFLGQNKGLTDSIQLAFINQSKQQITLLSIPRDLYYEGRKINEYLELYGPEKIMEVIGTITGFGIDKYIALDFSAFTESIDMLGGIEIEVEKKLIDQNYPDGGSGYKTIVFETGLQRMSGERSLEYARSRKSTSDFDRSLRQQKILIAIKEKLRSSPPLDNINFYLAIFQKLQNKLRTNLNIFELLNYFDQYKDYHISAGSIMSNENFLYSSKSLSGQSILLPKDPSFSTFRSKLLDII